MVSKWRELFIRREGKHFILHQKRLYLPIMNRVDEEVNKPTKGVLVHGINVCQVRNTKKQH